MKIEVNDIMYGSFKINGIEKDIEVSIMAAWGIGVMLSPLILAFVSVLGRMKWKQFL